jgi:hypothetical protein
MRKTTTVQLDPAHYEAITELGGSFTNGIKLLGEILLADNSLAQTIKDIPIILKAQRKQKLEELCNNLLEKLS